MMGGDFAHDDILNDSQWVDVPLLDSLHYDAEHYSSFVGRYHLHFRVHQLPERSTYYCPVVVVVVAAVV